MLPYWVKFKHLPDFHSMKLGAGVTARDADDARAIVREAFGDLEVEHLSVITDVNTLDPGHVRPNMGSIFVRGIWFPLGFDGVGTTQRQ